MSFLSNPEEEAKEYLPRYQLLYIAIGLVGLIFFARLWYLQIVEGTELRRYSERNRVKEIKIPAPRGLILDRDGRVLVDNLPGFEATISPQYATRLEETAEAVGAVLGLSPQSIVENVRTSRRRNGPFRPVRIKDHLNLDEVHRLKMLRWDHPGLNVNEVIIRYYPLGPNGAQLFGYVNEISRDQLQRYNERYRGEFVFEQGDIIGQSGLEEVWERTLRGRDGISYVEVDSRGREAATETPSFLGFKPRPAEPGDNLVLTIDRDIQEAAFIAMNREDHIGPRRGALVAMKANGEVLAWVNTPSFDPNDFSTGISPQLWSKLINDPFRPLRNKVIQDHFAPGSTFKPFVALAALQEKAITRQTVLPSPPFLRFGRRNYHDHSPTGHGNVTVLEAMERSSNVFFYKMGIALGMDVIAQYSRLLGLGQRTGVRMNNEVPGLIPDSEWKLQAVGEPWQPGENLSNAIGQGFVLTTPLQMAVAYNAIGLKGPVYRPYLVRQVLDQDNDVLNEFFPEVLRDASRPENEGDPYIELEHFETVKESMRLVANGERGTARWWKIPGVEMAGKTGTTQIVGFSADQIRGRCDERPLHLRHHGWYVGYAPAERPEITVAVLAMHSCAGSSGAAPIVRDVIKAYMEKYHPEKLRPQRIAAPEIQPRPEEVSE